MPWIVGIDEAGYGPNLGPLVMSAAACRIPDALVNESLWRVLRGALRRRAGDESRLLIQDSKLVYSPARGLGDLEMGVLAALSSWRTLAGVSTAQLLDQLCPAHHGHVRAEPWHQGDTALPVAADAEKLSAAAERFCRCCEKNDVSWTLFQCVVYCPSRVNDVIARSGSKGAVLGEGLRELLEGCVSAAGGAESLYFFVDKHGGRNSYAAMLQQAFPGGLVVAREEHMERSVYQVLGLAQDVTISIQPRADQEQFCVALASMISKYIRELQMLEFNRFWQTHVPGLKATAGYPLDAPRFYNAIRPALLRLGLTEATVWRQK